MKLIMDMLSQALIHKFGFAQGLTLMDGKITEYPVEWGDIPTKQEQGVIVNEYTAYLKSIQYKEDRKTEYDNGAYIDSLMKDAKQRRLAGEAVHVDLDKSLVH